METNKYCSSLNFNCLYGKYSSRGLGKKFGREWIFKDFDYKFISGKKYAITEDYKLYNLDSYLNALQNPGEEPVYIGYLDMDAKQIVYD